MGPSCSRRERGARAGTRRHPCSARYIPLQNPAAPGRFGNRLFAMWRLLALTLLVPPPPPAAAKATQGITDRLSIIESDPALKRVAYAPPSPHELMLQQEWLQRQR